MSRPGTHSENNTEIRPHGGKTVPALDKAASVRINFTGGSRHHGPKALSRLPQHLQNLFRLPAVTVSLHPPPKGQRHDPVYLKAFLFPPLFLGCQKLSCLLSRDIAEFHRYGGVSKPKELVRPAAFWLRLFCQPYNIFHPPAKPLLLLALPRRFILLTAGLPRNFILGCDGKAFQRVLPRFRPLYDLLPSSHHISVKARLRNKKLSVKNFPCSAKLLFKTRGVRFPSQGLCHLTHNLIASHRKNRHITAHTVKARNLADSVASWQSLLADRLDPPHPFPAEIIHLLQKALISLEAVNLPDTIRKLRCLRGHAFVKYHAVVRHFMDDSPVSVHLKGSSPQKPQRLLTDCHLSLHKKGGQNIIRVVSKPPGKLRIAGHNSLSHTGYLALDPVIDKLVPAVHLFKDRLPGKGQRRSPAKLQISFPLFFQKLLPVFHQRPCLLPRLLL